MTSHPQHPQAPRPGQQAPPPPRPAWTPPPPKPTAASRLFSGPDKNLRTVLALGLVAVAGWFAAVHTTLIYAWKGGSLSQVQGICDSSLGRFSQALSSNGAAECAHIDSLAMWWNLAGFAGLLAAGVAGFLLIYRAQPGRKPA